MDYTTLPLVKEAMQSTETVQDTVLSAFITRASRYLDKLCTSQSNVVDYFKAETITDEILTNGVVDGNGILTVFPHKPVTSSVASLSLRSSLRSSYQEASLDLVLPMQSMVIFEGSLPSGLSPLYVKLTYTGGLGATVADLPADFVDLATIMTVRLYKEARSGLGDSIGVAELGTLTYTKAFPIRVLSQLNIGNYMRTAPWI
jgi:hypothetical protein